MAVSQTTPETKLRASRSEPWTQEQAERFTDCVHEYLSTYPELLTNHSAWHRANGQGGDQGKRSGHNFLLMHRDMLSRFETWLSQHGHEDLVPIFAWNPAQALPSGLTHPGRETSNPQVRLPTWLMNSGWSLSPDKDPVFGHTRLWHFASLDELGRAMGEMADGEYLSYHGKVHRLINGDMNSGHSPKDPAFWVFHAFIDQLVDTWLTTDNGQGWWGQGGELLMSGPRCVSGPTGS